MKIWAKTEEFSEGKYLVVRRDGTVPEWPHFVLGGFDPCASAALIRYAEVASEMGYDAEYVRSIQELARDFQELAETDRARKIANPTAGPHRADCAPIVALMGGRVDNVQVVLRRERAGQRPDERSEPPAPVRGEIRIMDGMRCRFIERELEGDKWEVLGPADDKPDDQAA